jgi:hypothetical protein
MKESTPSASGTVHGRLFGIPADDRDGLGGGNVVARIPVWFVSAVIEILFDHLLSPREPVAPHMGEKLSQIG